VSMEHAIMERVPSFKRTSSRNSRYEFPLQLESQDYGVLALIASDLSYRHKLMFFGSCTYFRRLQMLEPGVNEDIQDVHERYAQAIRLRDRQVAEERRDFYNSMIMGAAVVLLTFLAQGGMGALYVYAAHVTAEEHPECRFTDDIRTIGICGISTWLVNLSVVAVQNWRRILCSVHQGQTTVASTLGQKPQVKFDLEAGQPLLEEGEGEEEERDGQEGVVLRITILLKFIQVVIGFVSFYIFAGVWWIVQNTESPELVDECGSFIYTLAYWFIWFLFTFLLCIVGLQCSCLCCFLGYGLGGILVRRIREFFQN